MAPGCVAVQMMFTADDRRMLKSVRRVLVKLLLLNLLCCCPTVVRGSAVPLKKCLSAVSGSASIGSSASQGDDGAAALLLLEQDMETEEPGTHKHIRRMGAGTLGSRRTGLMQPFELPKLILPWDSWATSQMVTAVAAILLSERLGFNVQLVSGRTTRELIEALSKGEVHMAFETWPASNLETFEAFVNKADSSVQAVPYGDLFGRSGIFETCSRQKSNPQGYSSCTGDIVSEPMLKEVLQTRAGQQCFATVKRLFGDQNPPVEEWSPTVCKTQNCTVEIFHISAKGYDEGKVEALVEKLKIPAKVVYLGVKNHTEALWNAYSTGVPALMYTYYPNTNLHGVSVLQLQRAKIAPSLDFVSQRLTKLAWKGLADYRAGDALAFMRAFEMDQNDYSELARLFDLYDDVQDAACAWLKKNPARMASLVNFPERKNDPFFCMRTTGGGLCAGSGYVMGWYFFLLQIIASLATMVICYNFKDPSFVPKSEERSILEKVISSAISGKVFVMEPSGDGGKKSCWSRWFTFCVQKLPGNYAGFIALLDDMRRPPIAISHKRTFENFVRSNTDPNWILTPPHGQERWLCARANTHALRRSLYSATCVHVSKLQPTPMITSIF